MKTKKQIIVSFHIGRGGRFYNAGHKTYLGEKTFQDLITDKTDYLYIRDRDEDGKFITPTLFDGSGNVASDDDVNGLTGTLDFDGYYDTDIAKYIEDCTDDEIDLIKESDCYKSSDLESYLNKL